MVSLLPLSFKRFILFGAFLIVGAAADAQENADTLYAKARQIAFEQKDHAQAISIAHHAVSIAPGYVDLYIFLGRLHAWNNRPDSGRYFFKLALAKKVDAEDAYIAYADLEIWNNKDGAALEIINTGLAQHPGSIPLLLRKARVLSSAKNYKQAVAVTDSILKMDRGNAEARALMERINDRISRNRIGVYADYVYFNKQFPDPWRLGSIDYTRQTKQGAFTGRINYAQRFKMEGFQYEFEAYPRISKMFYTYVNLGFSDHRVFPKWRGGFSVYANLPKAYEAELGIRYLYFSSSTFIYTAYAGKYVRSFLFGGRFYLTPNANKNIAQTYSLLMRYYFGRSNNYIGFNIGAGISPDDRLSNVQLDNNIYKLTTYRTEFNLRYTIRRLNILTMNASIINQEYNPGQTGLQMQAGIGYIRRF